MGKKQNSHQFKFVMKWYKNSIEKKDSNEVKNKYVASLKNKNFKWRTLYILVSIHKNL